MAATAAPAGVRRALREADAAGVTALNEELAPRDAEARVACALSIFGERIVLASSFGAQAAVMLHLVTRQAPSIPVVLIDTGYLFAETYRFVDTLTARLSLNVSVYRSELTPAWQEARYGRLWEQGAAGLERYNRVNKIEPMQRALGELGAEAWFAGLRRAQGDGRANTPFVALQNGRIKIHPIADWSDREVHAYLSANALPYHPLWHEGYPSIGDWHTTRPLTADLRLEETRFHGLKRECGLHESV